MIWPPLAKVQWERLPQLAQQRRLYFHLFISFLVNWLVAPLVMVAVAWMTLPEASMESERKGIVLVGVGMCSSSLSPRRTLTVTIQLGVSPWSCEHPFRMFEWLLIGSGSIWTGIAQGDTDYW